MNQNFVLSSMLLFTAVACWPVPIPTGESKAIDGEMLKTNSTAATPLLIENASQNSNLTQEKKEAKADEGEAEKNGKKHKRHVVVDFGFPVLPVPIVEFGYGYEPTTYYDSDYDHHHHHGHHHHHHDDYGHHHGHHHHHHSHY